MRLFKKSTFTQVIILLGVLFFIIPQPAFAVTPPKIFLEVPFGNATSVTGLGDYLRLLYEFIVAGIGVVSAVMIMIHGIQWSLAGGNSEIVSKAKEGILNAIIALVIAFGSYMILYIINPQLVDFDNPNIQQANVPIENGDLDQDGIADDPATECGSANLKNFKDTLLATEPGKSLVTFSGSSLPCINQSGYTALERAINLLNDPNAGWNDNGTFRSFKGMKLTISSAYRSNDQQQFLYQCYQGRDPATGACPVVNGKQCTTCSQAATPGTSRHESGTALDMSWTAGGGAAFASVTGKANSTFHDDCLVNNRPGVAGCTQNIKKSITGLEELMQQAGFNRICVEWWHFQIGGSGTCAPGVWR